MTSDAPTATAGTRDAPDARAAHDDPLRLQTQLRALLDAGVLDQAAYQRAVDAVQQRLPGAQPGAPAASDGTVATARPGKRLIALAGAITLAAATAGYALTGHPDRLLGQTPAAATPPASAIGPSAQTPSAGTTSVALPMDSLAERLAQRLKTAPDDADGWLLLGRAYLSLGRGPEAIEAVQRAAALRPGDRDIQAALTEARAAPAAMASPMPEPKPATGNADVAGIVTLSPELLADVQPDDTVFVTARRAEGSRMPLAVLRQQVRDLPLTFTLDDRHAMSPDHRLSSASSVIVQVRVSRRGQATPQSGDLEGSSPAVPVGQRGMVVTIARRVP